MGLVLLLSNSPTDQPSPPPPQSTGKWHEGRGVSSGGSSSNREREVENLVGLKKAGRWGGSRSAETATIPLPSLISIHNKVLCCPAPFTLSISWFALFPLPCTLIYSVMFLVLWELRDKTCWLQQYSHHHIQMSLCP